MPKIWEVQEQFVDFHRQYVIKEKVCFIIVILRFGLRLRQ